MRLLIFFLGCLVLVAIVTSYPSNERVDGKDILFYFTISSDLFVAKDFENCVFSNNPPRPPIVFNN